MLTFLIYSSGEKRKSLENYGADSAAQKMGRKTSNGICGIGHFLQGSTHSPDDVIL